MLGLSGLSAALVTVLLWASAFPMIRVALRDFSPIPLAAMRFSIAAALLFAWAATSGFRLPTRNHLGRFALCGGIGIAFYNVLLNSGQQTVSAGAASFIVNAVPVITAVLAVMFLGERFRVWAWIGTAVSLAGIALIAAGQPGGLSFGAGAMLILGAAACQAIFFVLQRPLIAAYGAKLCAAIVVGVGAACLAPWLPTAIAQAQKATWPGLAAVAYLGVFPAAVGYATWGIAQANFGASRAANFLYLVPPTATGLAILIACEFPTLSTIIGGVLAVAGVVLVNTKGRA